MRGPAKKDKRWYFLVSGIVLLILIGAGLWIHESNQIKGTMTEHEFSQLQDKEMEIVDTSVFLDEKLEEWYRENRQVEGEYLYPSGNSTYILVSIGEVKNENTFLLLNGVKDIDGKLAIGYDSLVMEDVPNIEFEDSIRSTLVKVKGNYEEVSVVNVEEATPGQ